MISHIKYIILLPFRLYKIYYDIRLNKPKHFSFRLLFFTYLKLHYLVKTRNAKHNSCQVKIHNYRILAKSYVSLLFLYKEIFISEAYYFKTDQKQPIIFDCGANIGMATIYFKALYPESKIVAFEPDNDTFVLLRENVMKNNLSNIELFQKALSNNEEAIAFYQNFENGGLTSSLYPSRVNSPNIQNVECSRLSDHIKDSTPDLIKIDVEGAEFLIFDDLVKNNVFNAPSKYIIEYHHKLADTKSKLSEFLNTLEKHNFEYNIKANLKGENSFQDILIYAYNMNQIE